MLVSLVALRMQSSFQLDPWLSKGSTTWVASFLLLDLETLLSLSRRCFFILFLSLSSGLVLTLFLPDPVYAWTGLLDDERFVDTVIGIISLTVWRKLKRINFLFVFLFVFPYLHIWSG